VLYSPVYLTKERLRPHLGSGRKIHEGQRVHSSLVLARRTEYIPKARPLDDDESFWRHLLDEGATGLQFRHDWLEHDLADLTWDSIGRFISDATGDGSILDGLRLYTATGKSAELQALARAHIQLA